MLIMAKSETSMNLKVTKFFIYKAILPIAPFWRLVNRNVVACIHRQRTWSPSCHSFHVQKAFALPCFWLTVEGAKFSELQNQSARYAFVIMYVSYPLMGCWAFGSSSSLGIAGASYALRSLVRRFSRAEYSACEVSDIYRNRKIFRWDLLVIQEF